MFKEFHFLPFKEFIIFFRRGFTKQRRKIKDFFGHGNKYKARARFVIENLLFYRKSFMFSLTLAPPSTTRWRTQMRVRMSSFAGLLIKCKGYLKKKLFSKRRRFLELLETTQLLKKSHNRRDFLITGEIFFNRIHEMH